ncbi:MAG: C40 family peptidase [Alphaproteobacteria bacterium]|nr:C40 family peptidase [Alphaproteobacteria bacterium]
MGKKYQVLADSVVMTATPEMIAEATNELLYGEQVEVIGQDDEEWVQCRSLRDEYEGYVPRGEMDDEITDATHKIAGIRGFAYTEADYKSPPVRSLSFGSPLSVFMEENGYALLSQGGWIPMQQIRQIHAYSPDIAATAEKFLGVPYLWGGRTSIGLDCSALVQLCLLEAGIPCPRDTKDQIESVGETIEFGDTIAYGALQRGDLVFFDGHVGIMMDDKKIINATARKMHVVIESLDELSATYGGILGVRRVSA